LRVQRVLVIGSSGAGKSTLARRLGALTGLPVEHLDRHTWLPGWVEIERASVPVLVERLAAGEHWIIDGNYSATLPLRLERADTVVFLDYPRTYCVRMALRRFWTHRGKSRPCMTEGCPEKIDLEFLGWIWGKPPRSRPKVLRLLGQWLGIDAQQAAQLSEYTSTLTTPARRYLRFTRRAAAEQWLERLASS
jgi:adenylate kinase family enzyme